MNTQPYLDQQTQLLARKALLNDEVKNIDNALGQIAAVLQFAAANAPAAESVPAEAPAE